MRETQGLGRAEAEGLITEEEEVAGVPIRVPNQLHLPQIPPHGHVGYR